MSLNSDDPSLPLLKSYEILALLNPLSWQIPCFFSEKTSSGTSVLIQGVECVVVDQPPDPIEQKIPDLYPSCAITRAMVKKAKPNSGMQDITLADTLIGQSFNDEISNSLSPSQSDIQTDFDTSRSNLDLSPSISNDQLSSSQLC